MKKLFFVAMTCIIVWLVSILPASAQTPTQDDEYKATLKKIMTISGASATTDNILPQLIAMTKNSGLQKDEAYWKDFSDKWLGKIQDKVMEIYIPIYKRYLTLDDLKKVVAFYESAVGKKLGKTAPIIMTEGMPMIQQLSMEMVKELMPTLQGQRNTPRNDIAEQNKKRDQAMFDRAYTVPKDSVKVADRTYQRGEGTMPSIYSIERRKNETEVTFLQPIYFDWQWLHFGRGFKIVDKKSGDEYNVRGYGGGAPFGELIIIKGLDSKYIYVSLLFPKLKKSVKEIDIVELPHEKDVLPSNDDGMPKSYFNIKVEDYQVASKKNKKVYH